MSEYVNIITGLDEGCMFYISYITQVNKAAFSTSATLLKPINTKSLFLSQLFKIHIFDLVSLEIRLILNIYSEAI